MLSDFWAGVVELVGMFGPVMLVGLDAASSRGGGWSSLQSGSGG